MVDVYDCSHGICVCIYMSVFYLLLIPAVVLFWFVALGRKSALLSVFVCCLWFSRYFFLKCCWQRILQETDNYGHVS